MVRDPRNDIANTTVFTLTVIAFMAALAGPVAARAGEAASFIPLGDLPGGDVYSMAYGVSADGSTVVGASRVAGGEEAFRWTSETGMVGLGDLPGGSYFSI